MCNTRNEFPYTINYDWFAWCGSLLWLYNYCCYYRITVIWCCRCTVHSRV